MADVPDPESGAAASSGRPGWVGCALAWMPVVLVEMVSISNEWLLVFLVPPLELGAATEGGFPP